MLMQEEREQIVEIGKQMSTSGLCPGTSGNQSIYNPELGLMAIKPSGIGYMETTPEDVVIMDLESHVVDGKRKPSSEWDMHTEFYKHKPNCRAIVSAQRLRFSESPSRRSTMSWQTRTAMRFPVLRTTPSAPLSLLTMP